MGWWYKRRQHAHQVSDTISTNKQQQLLSQCVRITQSWAGADDGEWARQTEEKKVGAKIEGNWRRLLAQ